MALELADFGVAFGEQVVLESVDLTVRDRGITLLVGAAGSGKSTLLRTLAGLNDAQPSLRVWGERRLEGSPIVDGNRPTLVKQNVRLLSVSVRENLVSAIPDRAQRTRSEQDAVLEEALGARDLNHLLTAMGKNVATLARLDQRRLSIVRALLQQPLFLFVDEPMTGLATADAELLMELLLEESAARSVLIVTHNQRYAQALSGQLALLGGGRIQFAGATDDFFANTQDDPLVSEFLRTGRLGLPSPNARAEELDPRASPVRTTARSRMSSRHGGPRGFCWLIPDKLGGCPRPGIISNFSHDLEALAELGTTHLLNLEEEVFYDLERVADLGIHFLHLPIVDMQPPSVQEMGRLSRSIDEILETGGRIVTHCRAGLGRTGTVLALYAIWQGLSASESFDLVRSINPKWIQSDTQIEFLPFFESQLARVGEGGTRREETETRPIRS